MTKVTPFPAPEFTPTFTVVNPLERLHREPLPRIPDEPRTERMGDIMVTEREAALIRRLCHSDEMGKPLSAKNWNKRAVLTSVKRVKDAPFEIVVEGTETGCGRHKFSAHIIMWSIRSLVNWCSSEVAELTDYPYMAESGDWSAVRDSCREAKDEIFYRFVLCKLPLLSPTGRPIPKLKKDKAVARGDMDSPYNRADYRVVPVTDEE